MGSESYIYSPNMVKSVDAEAKASTLFMLTSIEVHRAHLKYVLMHSRSVGEAAEKLGMVKQTLWYQMRKLKLTCEGLDA